jgi:hypothetical protein
MFFEDGSGSCDLVFRVPLWYHYSHTDGTDYLVYGVSRAMAQRPPRENEIVLGPP